VPIPKAYIVTEQINNIGHIEQGSMFFKEPNHIFIDSRDCIYIVDTGNSRIVKMSPEFDTEDVFYGPEDDKLSNPEGIFVDDTGSMYIADTGKSRVVHLSAKGEFIEQFTNPESEAVSGTAFNPSKLIVSETGYIYVVRGENIMAIDANNGFRGLFGQTNIGYSFTENILRLVATEEQMNFFSKRLASSYLSIALGNDGMIYATSLERVEGEIKKLNSIGNNVYRKYSQVSDSSTNPIINFIKSRIMSSNVASNSFKFGEYFDDEGAYMEPVFRDITVDANGIVTVVEELSAKVYQYDQEGMMLAAFGGKGEQKGKFNRPSSVAVDSRGRIFVADRLNNNFQVFEPTEFITTVQSATTAYNDGEYDKAHDLWNNVLKMNENYELAHLGIAKAYYKQEKWEESMAESKIANDRSWYTKAFDEYKYVVLRSNFLLIVVAGLILIVGLVLLALFTSKAVHKVYWNFISVKSEKMTLPKGLLYAVNVVAHPLDTLEGVRYNKARINLAVPIAIFALAYAVRLAYLLVVHYPLASINTADINIAFEAVKLWIIPVTWVVAAFAVTSISDGESKAKEIFFTAALCLVPFILINTPLMFLSNILSKTQQSWYGVFSSASYIWMAVILVMSLKVLNDYSLSKALKLSLIIVFVILVVWLVAGLLYVLTGRLVQFISGVMLEFRMAFF
jgi:streptogramin lyase